MANCDKYESITQFLQSLDGKKASSADRPFAKQSYTANPSSDEKTDVSSHRAIIMAVVPELLLILLIVCGKIVHKFFYNNCSCKVRDMHMSPTMFFVFILSRDHGSRSSPWRNTVNDPMNVKVRRASLLKQSK
jgi:hypothetical protein